MFNQSTQDISALLARVLMSVLFLLSGYSKLAAYSGSAAYMESAGVPGILLPLVIVTELAGGLLILIGYQTRIVALLLAGFTMLAGLLFHLHADQDSTVHFLKNLAIVGGFLALVSNGAGALSLDARLEKAA